MDYNLWFSIVFSIAGGFLPMLVWLFFWLRHDAENPEPKKILGITLLFGALVTPFAVLFQKILGDLFLGQSSNLIEIVNQRFFIGFLMIVAFSSVEEILKYVAAYQGGLKRKENDEPIDPMIYLITAALGFAAIENTLYILSTLINQSFELAAAVSNVRFIGATLVHVTSSALIGVFIGLSYYDKDQYRKQRFLVTGFILAILLHSLFNFLIIKGGIYSSIAYSTIWFTAVIIIAYFEKIKLKFKNKK